MNEREIFVAALSTDSAEAQSSYLDSACQGDEALRGRIEALLVAEGQLGDFMETSPVGSSVLGGMPNDLDATADLPATFVNVGTMIGPYKILKPLGEGGFGIVFLAEQTAPVRRKVAIKVIKPGMDTKEVIRRFKAERQAMALMDHPHIAKVLDCGETDAGAPYVVMEMVNGIRITEFCDQNVLTTRERLKLFTMVCQGVQHAHQKGIIHRDIKPSNILVTKTDGVAIPKIIDFGISKAIAHGQPGQTANTEFGRMLGTPLYMSPEQASLSGVDVDTRTDVYSLGVVLYELLTGSTPFDKEQVRHFAGEELRRMIQAEDPLKPSTRVSTLGATASAITAHRQTDPERLRTLLKHDLDWIVMKALEKDRERRYPTAAALADDIHRYLDNKPVEAYPPSPLYRFSKFARRHRSSLAMAASLAIIMVTATAVSVWQSIRASQSAQVAREEAAVAEAVLSFINRDLLGRANPGEEPNRELKVREALDRAALRVDGRFPQQPLVEAAIRQAIGTSYLTLGEYHDAQRHLSQAFSTQERLLGINHRKTLTSQMYLGICLCEKGLPTRAEAIHRRTIANLTRQFGKDDEQTLAARTALIASIFDQGRYREAQQATKPLLDDYRRVLGGEHPTTLRCMGNVGNIARVLGNLEAAETICRELLEIQTRILREDHPDRMNNLSVLGNIALSQGRYPQAIELHQRVVDLRRRVLGEEHPITLNSWNNLSLALSRAGQLDEAERTRRDVLEVQRRVRGDEHPATLDSLMNLANLIMTRGQLDEAEDLHTQVLDVRKRVLGEEHPKTLMSEMNLLNVVSARGRFPEAEERFRQLLEIQTRVLGELHPSTLAVRTNLSTAIHRQGKKRLAEAEALRRETLLLQTRALGERHPDTLATQFNLANTVTAQGKTEEAEKLYDDVYSKMKEVLGDAHPVTLKCMLAIAKLATPKRPQDAEKLYRTVLATQRKALGADNPDMLYCLNAFAWFLAFSAPLEQQSPAEAVTLAAEALERSSDEKKYLPTLAQAQFRNGQWSDAKQSLLRSLELRGANYHDLLTLALVHWQLGEEPQAKMLYEKLRNRELKNPRHLRLLEELKTMLASVSQQT